MPCQSFRVIAAGQTHLNAEDGQELLIIPPRTVSLRLHPLVIRSFVREEMHGAMSPHGEVLGCVALPNTAVVLAKSEVEPPVAGVLEGPMPVPTFPHLLGVRAKTADVGAPLSGGLMALCPPRVDPDDGLQTHPLPPPLQPGDGIGHGGATAFHSPVACGLGLVRAMGYPLILLAIGPLEAPLDISLQGPLMPFAREDVLRLLLTNRFRTLLLGPPRVDRHKAPCQCQDGQSLGERRDLMALLLDGHLAQHEACLRGPCTDQGPWAPADGASEAMPRGLAINSHALAAKLPACLLSYALQPAENAGPQRVGVHAREHPRNRIM
jgi:hypothetical protein